MSFRALAVLSALVFALVWGARASAAEPASAPPSKPMAIKSGSMTVKNLDQRVVFDRDVTITKGDMDLSADRVEIILLRPAEPEGERALAGTIGPTGLSEENIERIEAEGRVKVVQGKKTATADRAVYHRAQETIVLTGRPESWEEGVRIQGSKITILLKEQRSIVEESKVVIYPEGETGAAGAPTPVPTLDGG